MISSTLYSSRSEDWATPPEFFSRLDAVFHFRLDACASEKNAKCERYFTKQQDALPRDWFPYRSVWMNPPYGRDIARWMKKAYNESRKGCVVVCLVHARTDTKWWHDWVHQKAQVVFVKGRLKFGDARNSAPFPSAVVIYGLDTVIAGAGDGWRDGESLWSPV